MTANIVYTTDAISRYYSTHRRHWGDLYPSERAVFDRLAADNMVIHRVLDVGCAAGGLAEILPERFPSIQYYTGVDINRHAIEAARQLTAPDRVMTRFITADICNCPSLAGEKFELVTALSVADWNVDADGILSACWACVAPGGHLVTSLRLTTATGTCDIDQSFQYIWFESTTPPTDAERAAYNVFNVQEALGLLSGQKPRPDRIAIHGYWGKPSATARTPYERLLFTVIAIRRAPNEEFSGKPIIDACLPADAFPGT